MIKTKKIRVALTSVMLLITAACATPSPNLIPRSEDIANPETQGVLAWEIYNNARGGLLGIYGGHRSAFVGIQKEGTQKHFYAFGIPDRPGARVLPVGDYKIKFVANDLFLRVAEPMSEAPFNPDFEIPVKPFRINPGEVVYTGTLIIHGLRNKQFIGQPDAPRIRYQVIDESDKMRAYLKKEHPEYAEKMVTRLFEIVGKANIYVPETQEDTSSAAN